MRLLAYRTVPLSVPCVFWKFEVRERLGLKTGGTGTVFPCVLWRFNHWSLHDSRKYFITIINQLTVFLLTLSSHIKYMTYHSCLKMAPAKREGLARISVVITHTKKNKNQGANYKKILRLSYDVITIYDNRKMLLITKTSYKMFL